MISWTTLAIFSLAMYAVYRSIMHRQSRNYVSRWYPDLTLDILGNSDVLDYNYAHSDSANRITTENIDVSLA